GARPAGEDASDWVPQHPVARGRSALGGRFPSRSQGNRLRRGPERGDRISLGARPIRSIVRAGCRQVALIAATGGDPSPQVAKAATRTIPIVFTANGDPVGMAW